MNGVVLPVLSPPSRVAAPAADVPSLLVRIRRGDPDAFTRLYDDWFDHVHLETRRRLAGDDSACLDVVQDVFVRAMRVPPLPSEAALVVWLRKTVRSCVADHLRREMRRRRREADRAIESAVDPRQVAELAEHRRRLRAALEEVDPACRRMLVLRDHLGWTLDRIGRLFGLTASAVDGRLRRSRARLRRELGEDHDA